MTRTPASTARLAQTPPITARIPTLVTRPRSSFTSRSCGGCARGERVQARTSVPLRTRRPAECTVPHPRARYPAGLRALRRAHLMGRQFDTIDEHLAGWIARQALFFVGSAPLDADGHVNVSPKGPIGSLRVLGPTTVAYLDIYGSGAETIAHLRENGRIVVMLCAFSGPPRILRLHGRGEVLRPGDDGLRPRCSSRRRSRSRRSPRRTARSCASRSRGSPTPAATACRSWPTRASGRTTRCRRSKRLRTGGPEAIADYIAERNATQHRRPRGGRSRPSPPARVATALTCAGARGRRAAAPFALELGVELAAGGSSSARSCAAIEANVSPVRTVWKRGPSGLGLALGHLQAQLEALAGTDRRRGRRRVERLELLDRQAGLLRDRT